MPTGIEEAGLALAIIPIVFSIIESYGTGIRGIKRAFNHKKTLRRIKRELTTESQLFEDAICKLLNLIFNDGGRTAGRFVHQPLADQWQDNELERSAKIKLGDKAWNVYKGHILMTQEILGRLLKDLSEDLNSDSLLTRQAAQLLQRSRIAFDTPGPRFQKLRQAVDSLQRLINGAEDRQGVVFYGLDSSKVASLREAANDLSIAIEQNLGCATHNVHVFNLMLRSPADALDLIRGDQGLPSSAQPFEILVHNNPDDWCSLSLRPRASNPACNACNQLQTLCLELHRYQQQLSTQDPTPNCLGFIGRQSNTSAGCYCICPNMSSQAQMQLTSLYEILTSAPQQNTQPAFFFERVRFKLAIILATSILGFYSTPWLPNMFSSQDILFLCHRGSLQEDASLRPYVARRFPESHQTGSTSTPRMVRNAQLYALGKLFIQLIEGRPLLDPADQVATPSDPRVDPEQDRAQELELTILSKAGKTWSDVIRVCLYGEFDMESSAASLENDDFMCRVYGRVIEPLVAALNSLTP